MVFRGHDSQQAEFLQDPLARFFALDRAFEEGRGLLGDRAPLRLLAANLIHVPGDPAEIAAEVRATSKALSEHFAWHSAVLAQIQLLIAGTLIQRGDSVSAFVAEVERGRGIMRELGMRRMEAYEVAAISGLRLQGAAEPVPRERVVRLHEIYKAMKRNSWMLTGPDDYPACAFLTRQAGTAQEVADRASAIYEALRKLAKVWRGDPLQTAANILCLGAIEPVILAQRFADLALAFDKAGTRIRQSRYDEVALLCFLAQPCEKIVERVLAYARQINQQLPAMERWTAFQLAANLTYAHLAGHDPELGPLSDAKALLDMQTIIAARQG